MGASKQRRAHTWGLASSGPTRRMQSAWLTQMRDQGVTAASASSRMNLRVVRAKTGSENHSHPFHRRCRCMGVGEAS